MLNRTCIWSYSEPVPDVAATLVARPKGKERVCRVCGVSGFAHRQALYRHIKKTHPHNQVWTSKAFLVSPSNLTLLLHVKCS